LADVLCAKGSFANFLKEVAHVVEDVVTLKNYALVVHIANKDSIGVTALID
jgi:hypothetical protein